MKLKVSNRNLKFFINFRKEMKKLFFFVCFNLIQSSAEIDLPKEAQTNVVIEFLKFAGYENDYFAPYILPARERLITFLKQRNECAKNRSDLFLDASWLDEIARSNEFAEFTNTMGVIKNYALGAEYLFNLRIRAQLGMYTQVLEPFENKHLTKVSEEEWRSRVAVAFTNEDIANLIFEESEKLSETIISILEGRNPNLIIV